MPRQKGAQRFWITSEVWEVDILVNLGLDKMESHDEFRRLAGLSPYTIENNDITQACCFVVTGTKSAGVWFRESLPPASLIAHEVFHLVHHILQESGVKLTDDSEEAYAYFISYLVEEITKRLVNFLTDSKQLDMFDK